MFVHLYTLRLPSSTHATARGTDEALEKSSSTVAEIDAQLESTFG